jgi:anti-sigma B factor antagonist
MQIVQRTAGDVTIVTVSGTITMLDPPRQLRDQVVTLVRAGRTSLVLSLGQLTFVDSSCIGELTACSLTVARAGGTLKLSNPSRRIRELLLVTRLGEIFETYETDAAAIASFGSGQTPLTN